MQDGSDPLCVLGKLAILRTWPALRAISQEALRDKYLHIFKERFLPAGYEISRQGAQESRVNDCSARGEPRVRSEWCAGCDIDTQEDVLHLVVTGVVAIGVDPECLAGVWAGVACTDLSKLVCDIVRCDGTRATMVGLDALTSTTHTATIVVRCAPVRACDSPQRLCNLALTRDLAAESRRACSP